MNKDQIKGRLEEAKGIVKETAGKVSGKENLEQEGKEQQMDGKILAGFGDIKEDIKNDK